jgi:hypothetical protein
MLDADGILKRYSQAGICQKASAGASVMWKPVFPVAFLETGPQGEVESGI